MMVEPVLVYRFAATKLVLLGLLGVLMSAVSAAVGFGAIPGADPVSAGVCLFGAAFFLLCATVAFARLFRLGRDVVTLTASGITDVRLAAGEIPWSCVTGIDTAEILTTRFVVLQIDPAVEASLPLTRRTRSTRATNRRLGIDGLPVNAQGLAIHFEMLLQQCEDYWRRSRPRPGQSIAPGP